MYSIQQIFIKDAKKQKRCPTANGKNSQQKPKITQILKLADKGLRTAIINNFKDSKENVPQRVNRWGKFKRQKLLNEPNKNSRLNSLMSVIKNSLNGLNRKIDGQKSH